MSASDKIDRVLAAINSGDAAVALLELTRMAKVGAAAHVRVP